MASEMIAAQRTIIVAIHLDWASGFRWHQGDRNMQILITDREPPADLAQALHAARVEVIIIAPWAARRLTLSGAPRGSGRADGLSKPG
jgi:hypothetical protein